MDPEATLRAAMKALEDAEYIKVLDHLFDYYDWRVRGGFETTVDGQRGDSLASNLAADVLNALEGK